jgi:FAD/FMN-containing dehydrogenase
MPQTERRPTEEWSSVGRPISEDWHNWSGGLRFRPAQVLYPSAEDEVVAIVRRAREAGRTVRAIGTGHSSSPLFATDDVLVSLKHLEGLRSHDIARRQAWVGAGSELRAISRDLDEVGLSLPNYGDVATQTVAGVISTGTHGSGKRLHNLSMMLIGGRLVTGTGEVIDVDGERDRDVLRGVRVSLGTLGIWTELRLQLAERYELERAEWCTTTRECLPRLDQFAEENRNFDFYWYPRSDAVKLRCLNPPGATPDYSAFAKRVENRRGPPHEVIPKHSDIESRFEEMEYALPAEAGRDCFEALRRRILDRWRRSVGWRLLYRLVAGDDSWISPAEGREAVTISLHQNASLPYGAYFDDLEPIFRAHGGRPHWGKRHSFGATDLAPLYPHWQHFNDLRRRLDPDGVFATPAIKRLLGPTG